MYTLEVNNCHCHPETCCCEPYKVCNNGKKLFFCYDTQEIRDFIKNANNSLLKNGEGYQPYGEKDNKKHNPPKKP